MVFTLLGRTNMDKIYQCVPNFSEGSSVEIVEKIVKAISSSSQVKIIDYSLDSDHNRSVITFLGGPDDVLCGMLNGVRAAIDLIDLNKHIGGHPRIGAVDVIPVVPIQGATREEAIELSRRIGQTIGSELGIPVYLYEWSATRPERVNLAAIRKGGFESLQGIELTGKKAPDFGPSHIHPTAGASAVGARGPLIAFNVNLKTSDIKAAKHIASRIRSLRGTPHELIGVKAIGVHLTSRDVAQVSTNITQPDKTGLFEVFTFIQTEAAKMGIEVLESELIGASRLECLLDPLCRALKLPDLHESRVIDMHID
jgi:glutamate formiminotransferase / 5-formyltetrahydrofolate cyclo-ligase